LAGEFSDPIAVTDDVSVHLQRESQVGRVIIGGEELSVCNTKGFWISNRETVPGLLDGLFHDFRAITPINALTGPGVCDDSMEKLHRSSLRYIDHLDIIRVTSLIIFLVKIYSGSGSDEKEAFWDITILQVNGRKGNYQD
jgi:hypothetical protein